MFLKHHFISDPVPDSFQAFLVDNATFTGNEEYPILRKDMISENVPKAIMPFSKAINYRGDLSSTFICEFSPDESFKRVRNNPKRYLSFFKRTAGIIGFDYSIHSDMPVIKQKSQINDNLSLTYFFGNNGIPIIPNPSGGIDELNDELLSAIPQNCIIAIGTHGFIKTMQEQCEWYVFLEKAISALNPVCIVVYGSLNGKMFDNLKKKTKFVFFVPWINKRMKGVVTNVH